MPKPFYFVAVMQMRFPKRFFFLLLIAVCSAPSLQAQDFCKAIDSILSDAGTRFKNVRGATITVNAETVTWQSKIKVPGVIKERFVSSMGVFYEGALFQTKDKDAIRPVYDKYKKMLDDCLLPQHYVCSSPENLNKGVEEFRKLMYMLSDDASKDMDTPPPHVSVEVDYDKNKALYTLVLYIWEH